MRRAGRALLTIFAAHALDACDPSTALPVVGAPPLADAAVDAPQEPLVGPQVATLPAPCTEAFCIGELPSLGSLTAVADVDGDGRLDLLLGDGAPFFHAPPRLTLLRNGPQGFTDVTAAAGLSGVRAWVARFGDLDNDGDPDLVLGDGDRREAVLHNRDGRFERAATNIPPPGDGIPLALALVDLDRDGLLDIVSARGGLDVRGHYPTRVLLARPDGTFAPLASPLDDDGFTWTLLATDLDGDRAPDLLIGKDSRPQDVIPASPTAGCEAPPNPGLLARLPNGAFRSVGQGDAMQLSVMRFSTAFEDPSLTPMGIASLDADGDGRLDYFVTDVFRGRLFLASPDGAWHDAAPWSDAPRFRAPDPSWSAVARDLDRDGREDLVVTHASRPGAPRQSTGEVYLQGDGGRFLAQRGDRGLALGGHYASVSAGDLDGDGDDDLVAGIESWFEPRCLGGRQRAVIVRNEFPSTGRHHLRARLVGTVVNRDAVGALVRTTVGARTLVREVGTGATTLGSNDLTVDLGLGDARAATLDVSWPDGFAQRVDVPTVDRTVTVTEPTWLAVTPRDASSWTVRVDLGADPRNAPVALSLSPGARWVQPPPAATRAWTGVVAGAPPFRVIARAANDVFHGAVWVRPPLR